MAVTFERKIKGDCKHTKLIVKAYILTLKLQNVFKMSETGN